MPSHKQRILQDCCLGDLAVGPNPISPAPMPGLRFLNLAAMNQAAADIYYILP
jgi:hypothetical protein